MKASQRIANVGARIDYYLVVSDLYLHRGMRSEIVGR